MHHIQISLLLGAVIALLFLWNNNPLGEWFQPENQGIVFEAPKPVKQSMSVAQAYRAIPHQRTKFTMHGATMSYEEAIYLQQFFSIVDLAVVERVTQMRAGNDAEESNYMEILRQLNALKPPKSLEVPHKEVMNAINEHRQYLQQWRTIGGMINLGDVLVQSSHTKIMEAYQQIAEMYPKENTYNKQAFYDHLCALDFI